MISVGMKQGSINESIHRRNRRDRRNRRNLDSRLRISFPDFGDSGVFGDSGDYSKNATDCTLETSKRLRQRRFLHMTTSSRRTM
jgi:hypothetical protein